MSTIQYYFKLALDNLLIILDIKYYYMNIMKYFCHQRPDRSFFIHGHQFPVCSRCTGIIIGAASCMIYLYLTRITYDYTMLILCIILQLPYIIDGTTQYLKLRESNNILRLITGILGGVGVVIFARITRIICNILFGF